MIPFKQRASAIETIFVVAFLCPTIFGQATGSGPPGFTPPAYQILRQDEDWSGLAKGDDDDPFAPIKFVPLSESGSIWASFGGQLRERVESWNQFNFGAPPTAIHNDGFLLSRLLLHSDLHFGPHARFFIQEKNSFSTHRALLGGRRTSDVDESDVQNGFIDLSQPVSDKGTFTFRAGRQELLFGRQRFVGPSDWTNTRRTFNGFSAIFNLPGWNVTAFFTRPVKVDKYDFNFSDPNTQFFGVHSTGKIPTTKVGLDFYWYGLKNRSATYNGTAGREMRHTVGGHAYGHIAKSSFDYDLGGGYQFGSVGLHDISAFESLAQLGYSFQNLRSAPHLYVGYDFASGSHTRGGEVGTFNQLFPTAHSTLGYMDVVGRQNIEDLNAGAALRVIPKLSMAIDWHNFWRSNVNDALYDKRGAVVRPGGPGTSNKVGVEGDLTFKYRLDRHTQTEAGYGHFFPGEFIRQAGPHRPEDFGYLSFQITF
jgi:alginate export protein